MPVSSTDIKYYLSANKPENDTSTSGGARDPDVQLLSRTYADNMNGGAGEKVRVVSSNSGDTTQSITITGYGTDGTWIAESKTLNGTSYVETTATFKTVMKVMLSADCTGNVTVYGATTGSGNPIHVIPAGERGAQKLFLKATANSTGGGSKTLYEKIFVGNAHATDAIIDAKVWISEDEDAELTMDCERSGGATVTNGTSSVSNRLTEPSGYTWGEHSSEGTAHVVGDGEDGNLAAGEYQGIWVKLVLAEDRTPEQTVDCSFTLKGSAS